METMFVQDTRSRRESSGSSRHGERRISIALSEVMNPFSPVGESMCSLDDETGEQVASPAQDIVTCTDGSVRSVNIKLHGEHKRASSTSGLGVVMTKVAPASTSHLPHRESRRSKVSPAPSTNRSRRGSQTGASRAHTPLTSSAMHLLGGLGSALSKLFHSTNLSASGGSIARGSGKDKSKSRASIRGIAKSATYTDDAAVVPGALFAVPQESTQSTGGSSIGTVALRLVDECGIVQPHLSLPRRMPKKQPAPAKVEPSSSSMRKTSATGSPIATPRRIRASRQPSITATKNADEVPDAFTPIALQPVSQCATPRMSGRDLNERIDETNSDHQTQALKYLDAIPDYASQLGGGVIVQSVELQMLAMQQSTSTPALVTIEKQHDISAAKALQQRQMALRLAHARAKSTNELGGSSAETHRPTNLQHRRSVDTGSLTTVREQENAAPGLSGSTKLGNQSTSSLAILFKSMKHFRGSSNNSTKHLRGSSNNSMKKLAREATAATRSDGGSLHQTQSTTGSTSTRSARSHSGSFFEMLGIGSAARRQPKQHAARSESAIAGGSAQLKQPANTSLSLNALTATNLLGFSPAPFPTSRPVKETTAIAQLNDATALSLMQEVKVKLGAERIEGFINEYAIVKDIASGSFGKVQLVYHMDEGRYYACKAISKKRLRKKNLWKQGPPRVRPVQEENSFVGAGVTVTAPAVASTVAPAKPLVPFKPFDYMDLVRREIAILKKISRHPNIASLVEVLDDEKSDNLYMVCELCEYGPIMTLKLNEEVPSFSEDLARRYFRDMLLGLEYLHHLNIIHRDIKPSNILLNAQNHAVIGDFSISYCNTDISQIFNNAAVDGGASVLTPMFTPPELLVRKPHGSGVHGATSAATSGADTWTDIWPLGVTLYCFVHGHVPFNASDNEELYRQIQTTPIGTLLKDDLSDALKHLLFRLLDRNPATRITLAQAKAHAWTTRNGASPMISTDKNCARRADGSVDDGAERHPHGMATTGKERGAEKDTKATDCNNDEPVPCGMISDEDLEDAVRPAAVQFWDRLRGKMKRADKAQQ